MKKQLNLILNFKFLFVLIETSGENKNYDLLITLLKRRIFVINMLVCLFCSYYSVAIVLKYPIKTIIIYDKFFLKQSRYAIKTFKF